MAVVEAVEPAMEAIEISTSDIAVPAIVAVREAVQVVVPPLVEVEPPLVSPAAVALIVRWEVSGERHYNQRLRAPTWPGGASGVTWGIGYDGGQQTRRQICLDWSAHAAVERLQGTSGITGTGARTLAASLRDVDTEYAYASEVFTGATLPSYRASARRAFGAEPFDRLPADAQGALVSLVYNRGPAMTGDRRREMRVIRDTCVPAGDLTCLAVQLRAQCRLWADTTLAAGLCARRKAEAQLALGASR